jgi:hypothetical protein
MVAVAREVLVAPEQHQVLLVRQLLEVAVEAVVQTTLLVEQVVLVEVELVD